MSMVITFYPDPLTIYEQNERNSYLRRNRCLFSNCADKTRKKEKEWVWNLRSSLGWKTVTTLCHTSLVWDLEKIMWRTLSVGKYVWVNHMRKAAIFFWMKRKDVFALQKSSTPSGLIWDTNIVDLSLFRDTNMAVVTSYVYAPYLNVVRLNPFTPFNE